MPELRRSTRIASKPTAAEPVAKKAKTVAPKKQTPAKSTPKTENDEEEKASPKTGTEKVTPKVEKEENETKEEISELQIGDLIPDWVFLDQDEKEIHLAKLDKNIVVIFSYPRASTPGCTRQACGFRDNYNGLKSKAVVLGLSADSPKSQKTFATKHGFQYSLLSDPKKKLIAALGAKKAEGKIARSHWIFVDGKLKIKKIGISPEVSYKTAKEDIDEFAN